MKKKSKAISLVLATVFLISTVFSTEALATTSSIIDFLGCNADIDTNGTEQFDISIIGTNAVPSVTVGNGALLKTKYISYSHNGENLDKGWWSNLYTYEVVATNKTGSTGVYAALPGQSPKLVCIINVLKPVSNYPEPKYGEIRTSRPRGAWHWRNETVKYVYNASEYCWGKTYFGEGRLYTSEAAEKADESAENARTQSICDALDKYYSAPTTKEADGTIIYHTIWMYFGGGKG